MLVECQNPTNCWKFSWCVAWFLHWVATPGAGAGCAAGLDRFTPVLLGQSHLLLIVHGYLCWLVVKSKAGYGWSSIPLLSVVGKKYFTHPCCVSNLCRGSPSNWSHIDGESPMNQATDSAYKKKPTTEAVDQTAPSFKSLDFEAARQSKLNIRLKWSAASCAKLEHFSTTDPVEVAIQLASHPHTHNGILSSRVNTSSRTPGHSPRMDRLGSCNSWPWFLKHISLWM